MPGWTTNDVAGLATFTGAEQTSFDTGAASGASPQTGPVTMLQLATVANYFANNTSKTTVSGTRYTVGWVLGSASASEGVVNLTQGQTLTGINVLVGSTGGTDSWNVELKNAAGVTVANSALAGTTAGTANTWQQIPFTTPYYAAPGQYYISLQSNGTTAHPAVYNSPTSPLVTQSSTGTFGTVASITPPTTYTAGLGPVCFPYT
jgi:hypothetical protein